MIKYLLPVFNVGFGYAFDHWVKETVAKRAREAAERRGKPVLDYGCGQFFPRGDVNCDIVPRDAPNFVLVSPDTERLPFEDKEFGAAVCFHVLEHCDNPDHVVGELNRVADEVFIVVPIPSFAQVWLHPEHRWIYLSRDRKIRNPLYPHVKNFLKRLAEY